MYDIGRSVCWRESVDLAEGLVGDPASHTAAAVNNWIQPLTTEFVARTAVDIWYGANTDGHTIDWLKLVARKPEPVRPSLAEIADGRALLDANSAFG